MDPLSRSRSTSLFAISSAWHCPVRRATVKPKILHQTAPHHCITDYLLLPNCDGLLNRLDLSEVAVPVVTIVAGVVALLLEVLLPDLNDLVGLDTIALTLILVSISNVVLAVVKLDLLDQVLVPTVGPGSVVPVVVDAVVASLLERSLHVTNIV